MKALDLEEDLADLRSIAALAENVCADVVSDAERREGNMFAISITDERLSVLNFAVVETARRARAILAKVSDPPPVL